MAAVLLLPPASAAVAAGAGTLVAHLMRSDARDGAQALFNTGQSVLVTLVTALLLAAFGWNPARPSFAWPWSLLGLPVAAVVLHALNTGSVAVVAALESRQPVGVAVRRAFGEDPGGEAVAQVSLVAIGVLAAVLAWEAPWAVGLLAVPLAVTHATLRRQTDLRVLAERARLASAAGLAEAQRLAQLGSWEWDPVTDRQAWSEETVRLLGYAVGSVVPTYHHFLAAADPGAWTSSTGSWRVTEPRGSCTCAASPGVGIPMPRPASWARCRT